MNRIYLVGFMGVGKSTLGKSLAEQLAYKFVDIDDLFEHKYKLNISSFFEKYGEKLFRELEHKVLESTFELENTVIATGGGTPCHFDAMEKINNKGISLYLNMETEDIVERLMNAKKPRPLVKDKSHEEMRAEVKRLYTNRECIYKNAHLIVDSLNPDVVDIAEIIRKYNKNKET